MSMAEPRITTALEAPQETQVKMGLPAKNGFLFSGEMDSGFRLTLQIRILFIANISMEMYTVLIKKQVNFCILNHSPQKQN